MPGPPGSAPKAEQVEVEESSREARLLLSRVQQALRGARGIVHPTPKGWAAVRGTRLEHKISGGPQNSAGEINLLVQLVKKTKINGKNP